MVDGRRAGRRGLGPEFLRDLDCGVLSPLLRRVKADRTLSLELRADYINVYYRGGSLLRVSRADGGYVAFFDGQYFGAGELPSELPPAQLRGPLDVAAWLEALPRLKHAMDLFLGSIPKEERDVQQRLVRENNIGTAARSTDYYICDIEYATAHGRFDAIAVHWPSTPSDRKRAHGRRLVLIEVKYGDGALEGPAGLHSHVADVNECLADPANVAALELEMIDVFNQKRALGAIDCEKDLAGFSDERPLLMLVLANHDPDKSRLRTLLRSIPESPHAEVRIATGCLLGYGLFDPAVLTVEQAIERFGDRI